MKTEILNMQNVYLGDLPQRYSLKNFHMKIYQGEMVNLLGISGSGKTALYSYLIDNETLREGKVTYKNQTWKSREKFSAIGDVVCLGQKSTLIPGLSIAENLCIVTGRRKVKGFINKKSLNYRTNMLLKQYAPGLTADMRVDELTLVQRHMVELLRAIENEAGLIYIDDVFSSYGQMGMHTIEELLLRIKEKNISVIYAARRKDQLSLLSDRIIILRQGENVKTFYREDYADDLCQKWLIGNPIITSFERKICRTDEVILKIRDLTGPQYISGLNAEIHRGEITGFYDMNNSANLEAAHILIGETAPILGYMYLNGKPYIPEKIDDAIAHNVGYIPRERTDSGVVGSMSFAENLLLPIMLKMSLFSFFKNERVSRFLEKEYLEEMGIQEQDKDKEVSMFDTYVKTNVVFRKWILAKPDLLVCEDICEETDITMRNIIYRSLEELALNKAAILITSQNLAELDSICDTIYIMNSYCDGERVKEIRKVVIN